MLDESISKVHVEILHHRQKNRPNSNNFNYVEIAQKKWLRHVFGDSSSKILKFAWDLSNRPEICRRFCPETATPRGR